jgi:predicted regulator of Ras-like GTPase activity (Roadblock/LC7/MglB family)
MPLAGDLRDMALPDLIQLNCQDRRQARLAVQRGGDEAEVYFDDGEVVHARLGEIEGEEAIYQVLAWHDGQFNLETGVAPPSRTIEVPWSALLMGGLQRYDEALRETNESISEESYDMAQKKATLQDTLAELGEEVQGFMAAAIVGMDGLGIAEHAADSHTDMESTNAQMTLFIKLVQTSVGKLNAGAIEDNLLTTDKSLLLIRFLEGSDYYLGIVVDSNQASLGNLRLYSRIYAQRLVEAMPR